MLGTRTIMVLRELWGNKARTMLVVLSISVGVFAMGAILNSWIILIQDLTNAYVASQPASVVMGIEPFDEGLVSAVEGMREVETAEGRASAVVKLNTPDGEQVNLTLYAPEDYRSLSLNQMHPEGEARWPPLRRQLLVERSWASKLEGVEIGDPISVEVADGRIYEMIFAGYAHDLHHPSSFVSDMSYGYVTLDTLEWLGQPRVYTRLYFTAAQNADDKQHITEVAQVVKERLEQDGYRVINTTIPTPGEHFASPFVAAILLVLGILGVFSLFLSGALVLNTVSAVVARQVKRIGVMKAIGGQGGQIASIYLSAVIVFGLISMIIAVPLARIGTFGLTGFIANTINFDVITTSMPPIVLAVQAGIAIVVPIIAASIPVISGTRITVREAIADYGVSSAGEGSLIFRLISPLGYVSGPLALALGNTFRRKTRLALTLLTLTLAGAIFIAVLSVRSALYATFDGVLGYIQYDISVDFTQPYRLAVLEREARRLPEVTAVEGWLTHSAVRLRPDGTESGNYLILGVEPESEFLDPILIDGRWITPEDRNAAVVNIDFVTEEPDTEVGDTITLNVEGKEIDWTIVGIVTTQFSQPAYVYTSADALGRELGEVGYANQAVIRLVDSDASFQKRLAPQIEERFKNAGLLVGSTTASSDFIASFEARFDILIYFMLAMAMLLAVVGGLGLAGTMGLNVLERIREVGVMRAIGATDGIVQRVVLAEGVFIGVFSWLVGAALAFPLSRALSDGVGIAFAKEPLDFSFSFGGMFIWLVLAIAIALIAAYVPARNASRLTVREILAYE